MKKTNAHILLTEKSHAEQITNCLLPTTQRSRKGVTVETVKRLVFARGEHRRGGMNKDSPEDVKAVEVPGAITKNACPCALVKTHRMHHTKKGPDVKCRVSCS